jgi:Epoxide hydrolase N terminus
MPIEPFVPEYSADAVEDLRVRLERTRWPEVHPNSGWEYGADPEFLRDMCRYWVQEFDWKLEVERIATFPHFKFVGNGPDIHFIHVRGKGPAPIPLIITHGWPGSFLEMLKIIPMLADPASHGGNAEDSFDVVVPSLPGYGYSGKPGRGMNAFGVADLWASLMSELGYTRFAAQGGDLGAGVSTALGLRHASRWAYTLISFPVHIARFYPRARASPPRSSMLSMLPQNGLSTTAPTGTCSAPRRSRRHTH